MFPFLLRLSVVAYIHTIVSGKKIDEVWIFDIFHKHMCHCVILSVFLTALILTFDLGTNCYSSYFLDKTPALQFLLSLGGHNYIIVFNVLRALEFEITLEK